MPKIKNSLHLARIERGLSRKYVSSILALLGYKGISALASYEQGKFYPPLETALCLEIIYRRPVAYLWSEPYRELQALIRAREEELTTRRASGVARREQAMFSILDLVREGRSRITPATVNQFVGLQIAHLLADEAHAREYLGLSDRYSIAALIHAYHKTKRSPEPGPLSDSFHKHLQSTSHFTDDALPALPLLAVRITRRAIAIAVLVRTSIEASVVRELPSERTEVEKRSLAFIRWALTYTGRTVALESVEDGSETRRTELTRFVVEAVRQAPAPLWEVQTGELFAAFSIPPCRNRSQLRKVTAAIFPDLAERFTNQAALDAAALGLFLQVKRLIQATAPEERKRG